MIVDIRGVNTHNKGAHLMMIAVADRLQPCSHLSVSPNGSDFDARARLGLRQTLVLNQAPLASARFGSLIPRGALSAFGIVAASSIGGVIDAAGFAYSDSFDAERSRREARLAQYWDSKGVPRIFLPQAFGPFSHPDQAKWCRQLLEGATRVYARDEVSLEHLQRLSPSINASLSPDFTIGLQRHEVTNKAGTIAIVPNVKLLTHGGAERGAYVEALIAAARAGINAGLRPNIVVHEFSDAELAQTVAEKVDGTIFASEDPLELKFVLGGASVVVASRFHAVVSALSQLTPTIVLGWSHKYGALLKDFGVEHWLCQPTDPIGAAVSAAIEAPETATLQANRDRLIGLNDKMWGEVAEGLGLLST